MAVIKGQNLRIFIEDMCVAASSNSSINITLDVEPSSTKDSSEDEWLEQEPVGHNWNASVDAMVLDASSSQLTGAKGLADLIAYLKSGAKVDVEFDTTTPGTNQNRTASTQIMKGQAYVQDISIAAQNKEITTYKYQLIGTGDLTVEE